MRTMIVLCGLFSLIGCTSSTQNTIEPDLQYSNITIAEVKSQTIPIPTNANNLTRTSDNIVTEAITIQFDSDEPSDTIKIWYQDYFSKNKWNPIGYKKPEGSPPNALIFSILGQDGLTLYFRNIALDIAECHERTCVSIIDEGYITFVDKGLN